MNKQQMVEAIFTTLGPNASSKSGIEKVLDAQAMAVKSELALGNPVTLNGIGTISVTPRKARSGRNPRTGDPISIAAKNAVSFSAIKQLKDAVNR